MGTDDATNTPVDDAAALARRLRARLASLHGVEQYNDEHATYFADAAQRNARSRDPRTRDLAASDARIAESAAERRDVARTRIAETRHALDALRPVLRPRRSTCGAKCRGDGHACRAPANGRGGRCKLHGGRSTGPRTPEGRERCRAAALRRWHPERGDTPTAAVGVSVEAPAA